MDKIVIFEVGWLGDTVVTIPAMRTLRRHFPEAKIYRVGTPDSSEILQRCPYIDHFVLYQRNGKHRGILGGIRFLKLIRRIRPTIFVNFHTPDFQRSFKIYFRDNLFALLAGARLRVAYYNLIDKFFLTHPVPKNNCKDVYIVNLINRLIEKIGCPVDSTSLEVWFNKEDEKFVLNFLRQNGIDDFSHLICIHPGAKRASKRWKAASFAEIANWAVEKLGMKVVITGSANERELGLHIAKLMRKRPVIAAGRLSLSQTGALLKLCTLFLTNDTGVMHLAFAAGTPTVALFGPGEEKRWVPQKNKNIRVIKHTLPCSPCYKWECENRIFCMDMITVKEVKNAIINLLR